MKNFFSFSKNQVVVLITVFFVIVLGSLYFFIYIPNNQKKVEERHFKCLQNIEKNVQAKIDNSVTLLNTILITHKKNLPVFDTSRLKEYIANYPRQRFVLLPVQKLAPPTDGKPLPDSMSVITFNKSVLFIYLRKGGYQAGLKYSVKQFVEPLLERNIFDEYLVLKSGKIIYQSFPSGVTAISSDSLKTEKSSFLKGQIKTTHMSGRDYKLFAQQLSLKDSVVTITGLLSNSTYNFERTKLPQNVVLLLLTFAMGVILTMPWIKLYQMGNQDRLTVMDGISSFAVSMLLMSLIFFAFFKYNTFFLPEKTEAAKVKSNLADIISKRYSAEVKNTYNLLRKLDNIRSYGALNYDLPNIGKQEQNNPDSINMRVRYGKTIDSVFKMLKTKKVYWIPPNGVEKKLPNAQGQNLSRNPYDLVRRLQQGKSLDSVFKLLNIGKVYWIRRNGMEVNNWSAQYDNSPPTDYNQRNYFKNIILNKPYLIDNNLDKKYYVDQIISWTSNKFTSVLSIPSINKDAPVAAITFNLKCLNKPVLPKGLSYCIINTDGRVLYHSDTTKNLNENLLEEVSVKQKLSGLLTSQGSDFFKADYAGDTYNFYAQPIDNLPYYVVVFESTSFKNMRDIKIFSFSFYMLIVFFLIFVVQLLLIYVLCRKRSFFEKQYFDISWIRPDLRYHRQYNLAIVLNLLNIVLLIIFYNVANFLQFLFMLLLSATAVTLFVNILYSRAHRRMESLKYSEKLKGNAALVIIMLLINFMAITILHDDAWLLIGHEALLVALTWLLIKVSNPLFGKLRDLKSKMYADFWDFSCSYSFMIFTRLIITSGIPVALFYASSYNYQETLMSRYRHAFFVKEVLKAAPILNEDTYADLKNVYVDDVWIKSPEFTDEAPPSLKPSYAETRAALLFNSISYDISGRVGVGEFYNNNPGNALIFSGLFDSGTACTSYKLSSGRYLKLSSFQFNYKLPGLLPLENNGIFYWFLLIITLFVFWRMLHLIIRKLFALNLPKLSGWQEIDRVIITDAKLNSLLFIIGSPGSGKLEKIKQLIADGKIKGKDDKLAVLNTADPTKGNVLVVDMILIPDDAEELKNSCDWTNIAKQALEGDYALIIVNHFEYDIQSELTNSIKLNFLEKLLQRNKSKIFITSTVHPVNFLESLNERTVLTADGRKPEHDLERWHVLLGHFKIIIDMLTKSNITIADDLQTWEKVLLKETNHTHFLNKMQQPLVTMLRKLDEDDPEYLDGDSLAFKMQVTSQYFYMYIWQSLTKEEKFLLYDLAEDSLVNSFDDYNLTLLISKGLIIRRNGVLHLFNKGFRNFILTAIGTSEAMLIRKQITDNGNWNKVKTPLTILIVAALAFLFASQQESYSTIITYLGVLTAALPAVLKMISMFESSGQKSS